MNLKIKKPTKNIDKTYIKSQLTKRQTSLELELFGNKDTRCILL